MNIGLHLLSETYPLQTFSWTEEMIYPKQDLLVMKMFENIEKIKIEIRQEHIFRADHFRVQERNCQCQRVVLVSLMTKIAVELGFEYCLQFWGRDLSALQLKNKTILLDFCLRVLKRSLARECSKQVTSFKLGDEIRIQRPCKVILKCILNHQWKI